MRGVIKNVANKYGYEIRRLDREETKGSSHLGEDLKIKRYLKTFPSINQYFVDIGASNGLEMSNSYSFYKSGWSGLAVECDPAKFHILAQSLKDYDVSLAKTFVTPLNVLPLLKSFKVPKKFGVLSLDIDGYDYFVLSKTLEEFRPQLIIAEINEKIPPTLDFSVKYSEDYFWAGDHFYGQSISMLHKLAKNNRYKLAEVYYNNAIYVTSESQAKGLDPREAYMKGYLKKADRKEKFPWNNEFDPVYDLPPKEQHKFFKDLYSDKTNFILNKA
ncbi:hypothetical protein HYX70_04055 [Candidatus Saccharibacteria bacterium]|nr:hypothetical protein [Candidatus Saccharibacteria bacterium]